MVKQALIVNFWLTLLAYIILGYENIGSLKYYVNFGLASLPFRILHFEYIRSNEYKL